MTKTPEGYPLRYTEDFFGVSNEIAPRPPEPWQRRRPNYQNARQEIFFHRRDGVRPLSHVLL